MVRLPVDNSEYYERSAYPIKDKVFNAVVRLYERRGKRWQLSDTIVWRGSIYFVFDFFFMLLIIWLIVWGITFVYEKYGMFNALRSAIVIILLRLAMISRNVNLLIRQNAKK